MHLQNYLDHYREPVIEGFEENICLQEIKFTNREMLSVIIEKFLVTEGLRERPVFEL